MEDRIQQQIALEEESRGLGIERYRREVLRDQAGTPPGRRLLRRAVELMVPALDEHMRVALAGKASRSAGLVYFLQEFDTDLLALVTATACIQALAVHGMAIQTIASRIALQLEDTLNHELLRKADPKMYRKLQAAISKTGDPKYRHVVLRKYQEHARVVAIKWGAEERVRVGTLLVDMFAQNTGMADIETLAVPVRANTHHGRSVNTATLLLPTEATIEWLNKAHAVSELLCPQFLPMVVEPRDWAGPHTGGYLTKALRQPVVKTSNEAYLEELRHVDLSHVYGALNAVQRTAWAVNEGVMGVLSQVWDISGTHGGLPSRDNLPVPAQTHNAETQPEAHKAWRKAAAQVHDENHRLRSRRIGVAQKIGLAKRLTGYGRFWFAHNLDWRGRAYALGSHLTPQGDDVSKALLQFADGCPLGDGGAFWLAVHGANCYGVDKVTFDERVQWVQDHTNDILASALDPLVHLFWSRTDDNPWQFLAFCKEWAGLIMWTRSGRRQEDFVSHLPVGLDGSCNGLQNFSMAMRDEVGGAATNLIPADKPADIYQRVADKANAIVEADIIAGAGDRALVWKGKVNRKLAKRPTMTMPYGSGRFGFKDQLFEALAELKRDTGKELFEGPKFDACLYMAGVMEQSISQVVVRAREAMDWLQEVSGVAAKEGLPVRWTAPSGLPVLQRYTTRLGKRIDQMVAGRRYSLTLTFEGSELDKRKQRQGIAPNYVHSLDGAHLVRSVNYCVDAGVCNFAMVHDSFGTHAGNVDVLAHELRRAFVDQYSGDVLGKFREEIMEQLTTDKLRKLVPPVPAFGTLDPTAVMGSGYFFA